MRWCPRLMKTTGDFQDYIYIYPSYVRETFLYYLTAEDSFWISFKFNFYLFSQEL
jgi:hypothetical protein